MNREMLLIYQQIIAPWVAAGAGGVEITPLFYQDLLGGSEFLIYDADKAYIASQLLFYGGSTIASGNVPWGACHNLLNAIISQNRVASTVYDSVAAAFRYASNDAIIENIYFSRLTVQAIAGIKFSGYRINRV